MKRRKDIRLMIMFRIVLTSLSLGFCNIKHILCLIKISLRRFYTKLKLLGEALS